jgi:type II secretory ATPase GspE/PulE/Tfp pilus assembly ATPase PilB-like protein
MATLIENGVRLAASGETSLEEVLRVLPPEQRGA